MADDTGATPTELSQNEFKQAVQEYLKLKTELDGLKQSPEYIDMAEKRKRMKVLKGLMIPFAADNLVPPEQPDRADVLSNSCPSFKLVFQKKNVNPKLNLKAFKGFDGLKDAVAAACAQAKRASARPRASDIATSVAQTLFKPECCTGEDMALWNEHWVMGVRKRSAADAPGGGGYGASTPEGVPMDNDDADDDAGTDADEL